MRDEAGQEEEEVEGVEGQLDPNQAAVLREANR